MRTHQRRRQRLVLEVCAWIFIVPGVAWVVAHALLGHREAALHTLGAVAIGLLMLLALRRRAIDGAVALFCLGAWGMVLLLSLTLDIPSQDVGRGIHHYLLPIFVAQRFVLQGRSRWLHQGVPAVSLLLFVGLHLVGNPLQLESAMSDLQRLRGLQITALLSLGLCALLFRLQQMELRERGRLPLDLARALRQQQGLALHLQPQVDKLGRPVAAEALLRWSHPKVRNMPPARIVQLAQQNGLLPTLSQWTLQQAFQILRHWQSDAALAELRLALNVLAPQWQDAASRRALLDALAAEPDLARRLSLELPEAVMADGEVDAPALHAFARDAHALGVHLVLDRFGQGRTALAQLDTLPVAQLKTDPALLGGAAQPTQLRGVLQTLLDLGRSLGLEVVVHGVETDAQWALLRELGCERLQGWRIGPVMSVPAFVHWVQERGRP